jgi:two-component system, LuxR family, response regulator DctR
MAESLVVYLVDDEDAVRDALSFLLRSRGLTVRAFASGPALLAMLDDEKNRSGTNVSINLYGCFLLDFRMEIMSGAAVHDALLERGIPNPVLFLTGHGDVPMAVAALKKGAFDFLQKPYSDNELVDRIERAFDVDATSRRTDASASQRAQHVRARLASLTEREREVMQRVAAGKMNKIIADELCVSLRTVEVHRARVFAKLGVRSAAEVATLLSATMSTPN